MAASAGRHPISARCRVLGAPRSTCCHVLAGAPGALGASRGGHGARRLKVAPAGSGMTASRRRICGISREDGLSGAYSGRGPGASRPAAPPDAAGAPGRGFDGRRPRARVAADPAYVRAGSRRRCVRPLVDLHDGEVAGCSCGRRKDASPVEAAFSDAGIDALPTAFGIERSVSRPGNPRDDAVVESTNRILKRELVAGRRFGSEEELRAALLYWADWYSNFRIHSTLGCMSPVEFREAGLILS